MSSPAATSPDAAGQASASVTIYHDPACGTSRRVLALIRSVGVEPRIVEHLKVPPSRAELADLIRRMGLPARALLRRQGALDGALWASLGLGDPALADGHVLDAMLAHPVLIERPMVVTSRGTRLCRPAEVVLGLLPAPPRSAAPAQARRDHSPAPASL